MEVMNKLCLDLSIETIESYVITQYDINSRYLNITVTENGALKPLNSKDHEVRIKMEKPDKKPVFRNLEINSDGTVTIDYTEQMCAVAGVAMTQLQIIERGSGDVIHTFVFKTVIQKSALDDSFVSEEDLSSITKALSDLAKMNVDAKEYAEQAKDYRDEAESFKNTAVQSATNASTSESNAESYMNTTQGLISEAEGYRNETLEYKNEAEQSKTEASNSATESAKSATESKDYRDKSEEYMNFSKSYAIGTNGEIRSDDDYDNSKYYYEQAKHLVEGITQCLIPLGTIAFENLPLIADVVNGGMYNISDDFVTTEIFVEGAGHKKGAGTNVYKIIIDGVAYWDCMAGNFVSESNIITDDELDELFED